MSEEDFNFDESMGELWSRAMDGAFTPASFVKEVEALQKKRYSDLTDRQERIATEVEEARVKHEESMRELNAESEASQKRHEEVMANHGKFGVAMITMVAVIAVSAFVFAIMDQNKKIAVAGKKIQESVLLLEGEAAVPLLEDLT